MHDSHASHNTVLPYLDTPADSMEHGWFLKPIKVDKSRLCAVSEYDLLLHLAGTMEIGFMQLM